VGVDERKNKEREDEKSQPGDGEEHEGRKGEGETLCVWLDIKDYSAMRPLSTLSIVTYHAYCFLFRIKAYSSGANDEDRAPRASKGELKKVVRVRGIDERMRMQRQCQ
jgi:hypothetical protein